MNGVEVRRKVFRWAADRSGIAHEKLRKVFPHLDEWELGKKRPTLGELEKFAHQTLTPLGYFFLPEPPEDKLPIADLRASRGAKATARPSPNLLETVQRMTLRQDWMRDFLDESGAPQLGFVGSVTLSSDRAVVADHIRQVLGLEMEWARQRATWTDALRALHSASESAGVLVVVNGVVGNNTRRVLDPDEFQGFALPDGYAPLVFVNGADYKAAQMFTMAHELVHLWLGQAGVSALPALQPIPNDTELFCDAVAAEFLVPAEALRSAWPVARRRPEPFQELARRFKVSSLVAARRAQDLGIISRAEFGAFYQAYLVDERRRATSRKPGGDFYANQNGRVGRRFAEAVAVAARAGRILYSDAYRLTDLYGSTFDRYVQRIGVEKPK